MSRWTCIGQPRSSRFARSTAHIFLTTRTNPKPSLTIHPTGSSAQSIRQDMAEEPNTAGPYSLDILIPPETVFEADSGWISRETSLEPSLVHGVEWAQE